MINDKYIYNLLNAAMEISYFPIDKGRLAAQISPWDRNLIGVASAAIPQESKALAPTLTWRQGNGNWFAVDDNDGEVVGYAERQENGLWDVQVERTCFDQSYWSEIDARIAVQAELGWTFSNPVERRQK